MIAHYFQKQRTQRWLGASTWLLLVIVSVFGLVRPSNKQTHGNTADKTKSPVSPVSLIVDSLFATPTPTTVIDPTGIVRSGDVVFAAEKETSDEDDLKVRMWREVGFVSRVEITPPGDPLKKFDKGNRVTLALFDTSLVAQGPTDRATWTVHRSSGRLDEVIVTLLPDNKRDELQKKLAAAMRSHANEVTAAMLPLVMQSVQQSIPVIEDGLTRAIQRHQHEIKTLTDRYRDEILLERLVPLVRQEVLPIVRRHAQEPAEAIGREVWEKASLWRFGWRAVYDQSPLPQRDYVKEEWRRFVDEEVVPTVEEHLDEIALAVEKILRDTVANDRLRNELSEVAGELAADPQTRDLLRRLLNEAIVENQELRRVWIDVWSSPEAKQQLDLVGQRIEPLLREIGDEVMGTRTGGIEPGFARVLRNQILGKDRSWITVEVPTGVSSEPRVAPENDEIRLRRAERFMPYPVIHLAKPED